MVGLLDQQKQGGGGPRPRQGAEQRQGEAPAPSRSNERPREQSREQPRDRARERPESGPNRQEGDEQSVSPAEQAQYDQFVTNGMQMMYSEQMLPRLLQSLEGDGNPVEGLANATAMVALRLDQSAQENGREVSGDVKLHGATELMEQMADLANEAGIHDFSEEEMESALMMAMDLYREAQREQGTLPVEELTQDMQEVMQAEEQGNVEDIAPRLKEYARRKQQEGEQRAKGPTQGNGGREQGQRAAGGDGQQQGGGLMRRTG